MHATGVMRDVSRDPELREPVAEQRCGPPETLLLKLSVSDPDAIAELWARPEGPERDEFALAALRVGVLAMRQARGQLDADVLNREGAQLLAGVKHALIEHRGLIDRELTSTLKEYFDPQSGRFNERVDRLLKKDGELETILSHKISGDDSDLRRTLSAYVGRESALFRLLSPDESEGLLAALKDSVSGELTNQRERVLKEFSLDNKEGALCRLVGELTDHNGQLKEDLQGKIDQVVKEFSFDDSESALSRMKRTIDATGDAISKHLTLDDENSALFRLRRELMDVLKHHEQRAQTFQTEVQTTLAKLDARRAEAARSTRHGLEFESLVCDLVQYAAQRTGDVAEATGQKTGLIAGRKFGDMVVELGPDSAAHGAKIVIEAKEKERYSLSDALREIEQARKNRGAECGLFVFSAKSAPEGLEPFKRYGCDVVVVWDAEDAATDLYLHVGLDLARALCTRKALEHAARPLDFEPIDRAILGIEKQVELLDEVRRAAEQIKSGSDKILDRVAISRRKLTKQAGELREQMDSLRRWLAER